MWKPLTENAFAYLLWFEYTENLQIEMLNSKKKALNHLSRTHIMWNENMRLILPLHGLLFTPNAATHALFILKFMDSIPINNFVKFIIIYLVVDPAKPNNVISRCSWNVRCTQCVNRTRTENEYKFKNDVFAALKVFKNYNLD